MVSNEISPFSSTISKLKGDRIEVIYLARKAEGIAPLQKFVGSYVRNPAGIERKLVVEFKGFDWIVGAVGSYESLYDSDALINKVIWLCNEISVRYVE